MDYEAQLKLQAYVDGELSAADAGQVTAWLKRDPEAAALEAELRNLNGALAQFESELRLPETREFFWSKVERDIRRSEAAVAAPAAVPFHIRLRRFLMPVTGVALIAIAATVVMREGGLPLFPVGGGSETALTDSEAFTYRDYNAGTTLVWLSYPAENDLANEEAIGTLVE
jgi:anti-sigma factor RsiW